ncbi:MAG: D-alanyl-D-alanine carboxypeptidase family protein [Anaerovoracaceae bacterium]
MKKILKKILPLTMAIMVFVAFSVTGYGASEIKRPQIAGKSGVLYCENTGEIMYSKNIDTRIDPLSTTKLLTAVIAVQNLDLDKIVTINRETAKVGEATINLVEGEKISVRDLLYATLLPSANDAAYALGIAVSGNMKDFTKLMNNTAKDLGTDGSNFVNPNGLLDKNHYSTSRDMLKIARVAFETPAIRSIVSTDSYTIKKTNKSEKRIIKNHCKKFKYDGVFGGKTGTWDDYNCGAIIGYNKNGLELYAIVMNSTKEERAKDLKKILDYGTSKIKGSVVIQANQKVGKAKIGNGAKTKIPVYTSQEGIAYLPQQASKSLISTKYVIFDDLKAPIKKGDVVGKGQIYLADDLANEIDLVAKEDVDKGWILSYIGISNFASIIICIILILITMAIVTLGIIRKNNLKKRKRLREKRIMELAMEKARKEKDYEERDWRF